MSAVCSAWKLLINPSWAYSQVGEGRACWSLGNAHSAMGETETAFHYASRHLDIAKETGDRTGQATAQQNLTELGKVSCHLALL